MACFHTNIQKDLGVYQAMEANDSQRDKPFQKQQPITLLEDYFRVTRTSIQMSSEQAYAPRYYSVAEYPYMLVDDGSHVPCSNC